MDFFSSTVDEAWVDSTVTAFNNLKYDITDKRTTKWRRTAIKQKQGQSKNSQIKQHAHSVQRQDSDRFIPIRDEGNHFDQQQTYQHQRAKNELLENSNRINADVDDDDDGDEAEQHEASEEHKSEQHKILSFKSKAPEPSDGYISNLRVLYTVGASSSNGKQNGNKSKSRHICQTAERILDAPDLMDDFYLNLLDWGCNNIIAIGLGSAVYLWNSENGEIKTLHDFGDEVYVCSIAWNHDSQYIAVGTSSNVIYLFDSKTYKVLRKLHGHSARISSLSWNHSILSTGSADSTIRNNDVRKKNHLISIFGQSRNSNSNVGADEQQQHEQEICGLKWNNKVNARYLASGSNDNKCCIWCLDNPQQPIYQFTESLSAVKALAWCPWNENLLANGGGSGDRKIRIYNIADGNLCNYVDTESQVCSLVWNPFEREILSSHGFSKNQLSIWKYPSLKKTHDLTGHTSRVLHTALSPNGEMVCSAAADETLRFWRVFENTQKNKHDANAGSNMNELHLAQAHDKNKLMHGLNLRIR
eukprot:CAMPEP_0197022218 /NCGR_PEP_ID=MMETSP1384-20130603/3122_1 /TAXON_ID=29189 /ORGANISM="Ammonia sp." /LENGTH=528 /DNA_ID=CAMNT_0042450217 /DNA_START=84 /DNA_END=1670 /DNA_ORIENTATION=-